MSIVFERVNYIYQKGSPFEHHALVDIDLTIDAGEFVGLIGHTGCGKSTLIQLINGLLQPESGRILIDGIDVTDKQVNLREIRKKVGLCFQYPEYQLFEETVYKDIAFGPKNLGYSEEEIRKLVYDAAESVGLPEEVMEKSPFELSGGQKRRVAIAGVLAMDPEILILDEPTAGLDPRGRDDILSHIKALHKQKNKTVILVSHSMEDIAKTVSQIIVMDHGRVKYQGGVEAIFAKKDELEAIGLDVPQITRAMYALREAGISVNPATYTVDFAYEQIKRLLEGGRDI
jgi:energy-coupling factor transport system ATP-binding protein